METSQVHFRLDLLLQLIDTTTGRAVTEQNFRCFVNGEPFRPIPRGNGNFVFLNTGREDKTLTLYVYGYETCQLEIHYDILDKVMPLQQAFLIPLEQTLKGGALCSLTGILFGLKEIEAVSLTQSFFSIHTFDARKCLMKVFASQGRLAMEHTYYGLFCADRSRYERFAVSEEIFPDTVRLKEPLKEPFSVNAAISRVVFGTVSSDGQYLLRVRDDTQSLIYLVRYCVDGEERFQTIDFHNCRENELK